MINLDLLALRFEAHTGCSPEKAKKYTQRYVLACARNITQNYLLSDDPQYYAVGQENLRRSIGTIEVNGKREYIFNVFENFRERIYTPIILGSNLTEKVTMAQLNYNYEDILAATGKPAEVVLELYKPYTQQIAQDLYDEVQIDMRSLGAYIKANRAHEQRSLSPTDKKYNKELVDELDRNLKSAQLIYKSAEYTDGILIQVISESKFGRKYYAGPNLQTAPKIVRHAALGTCYEYDLESNVFAWKYTSFKKIAQQYEPSAGCPATLEYLDHKNSIRRRLARDLFDTEADWALKAIKKAITAIGFGAPARTTGYRNPRGHYQPTALNTHITSVAKLQKFLDDSWVKEFIDEQKQINDIIFEVTKPYNETEWRSIPGLVDAAGRLRKNSVISYLYQKHERHLMESICEIIDPSQPVLLVHDCIYTKKPVPLRELREQLMMYSEYYKIDRKEHQAYTFDEYAIEHRNFIREQEKLAQNYRGTFNSGPDISIPVSNRPIPSFTYNSDSTCADGSGYDGSGYENYNTREDWALDDDPDREEYQRSRDRIMERELMPDWVKQRIGVK